MGKKSWFSAVKKAVSPSFSKVKKDKRSHKSKSNPKTPWQVNQMSLDTCSSQTEAALTNPPKELEPVEYEQIKYVDSITYVTNMVEDEEDTCIITSPWFVGKSREEIGAIKIQTAYRGYLARKDFRALRPRMRLRSLIKGQAVKRQTTSTLTCMQTMARVQSQVRARRVRMAQVNEALQRQLLQRRENELYNLKSSAWDLSPKSKEQVEANLRSKKDAAERREKSLAYAYVRQQKWRNSSKSANPTFTDPNYLDWGWSWSERWNTVRPWETGTTSNSEPVRTMGKRVSSASSKGSTKSMNVGSRLSNRGPSRLGSGKKSVANTGSVVGFSKKRNLFTDSVSFGNKSVPRKSCKTIR